MSHFALVNSSGIVEQVIVAEQDFINSLPNSNNWVQTSYNTRDGYHFNPSTNEVDDGVPLRYNFAGIGSIYDSEEDVFYSQKPCQSWILFKEKFQWRPPFFSPRDNFKYVWDEEIINWKRTINIDEHVPQLPECFIKTGLLFLHIPKTAGMSTNRALYGDVHSLYNDTVIPHPTIRQWRTWYPEEINKLKTFTIIRNPVDRFVSAFYFNKNNVNDIKSRPYINVELLGGITNPNDLVQKMQDVTFRDKLLLIHGFRPQVDFIENEDGLINIDIVDVFDNLIKPNYRNKALENILNKKITITHVNKTLGKPKDIQLTEDNKQWLQSFYQEDYNLYNSLIIQK
jgi:hypothetical protein